MVRTTYRMLRLVSLLLVAVTAPEVASGQTRLLKRFDKNGDGVVNPSEVPESMKGIYRRLAERAGLDPDKPIRIEEATERIEQKVVKKLAEEGVQVSVTVTGARPKLYIRWPGQQGPPTKVIGRGLPPIKPRARNDSESSSRLPGEYARYDRDRDGQIGLYEWPRARIAEFLKLDKNQDGFLTPRELGVKKAVASASPSTPSSGPPAQPAGQPPAGPQPAPGEPVPAGPPGGQPPGTPPQAAGQPVAPVVVGPAPVEKPDQ